MFNFLHAASIDIRVITPLCERVWPRETIRMLCFENLVLKHESKPNQLFGRVVVDEIA